MTQATLTGLIKFINEQPEDRPVDHHCWATCAVGDYAHSLGEEVTDSRLHGFQALKADAVLRQLWNEAGTYAFDISNQYDCSVMPSKTLLDALNEMMRPETYGEMREALAAEGLL